jgi:integrase
MAKRETERIRGIYEREPGSGVWWIRYTDEDGKIRREKAGRRSDALTLYRKRKEEVRRGAKLPENLRSRGITFEQIGKMAIQWYVDHGKKDLRTFSQRMGLLIEEFGERAAHTISPSEIDSWLASHVEWSQGTRNRYKTVMSKAFTLALKDGKVEKNPARLVTSRKENNWRIRYLLPAEEQRLIKAIMEHAPAQLPAFQIALHTGMRQGEQFSLTWDNVDFARKTIRLDETKNGHMREVPLNSVALAILKDLHKVRPDDGPVFRSSRRKAQGIRDPKKWWLHALAVAKVKNFRWHDLRHTFCSRLVQAGVDIRTVAELAGHRNISITMRYAHVAPQTNLAAVEKLAAGKA